MYHLHTHCRACGFGKPGVPGIKSAPADKLIEVLDLGIQPLANDFCREGESRAGYAPLKVLFCPRCSLAQLSVVVRPEVLYAHYAYVTSKSATMRRHFDTLWAAIQEERQPKSVLEIGSNDGDFLDYARTHGAEKVLGVDPAINLAKAAEARGIPTVPLQFNPDMVGLLGTFDAIVARHVFCHVDDWQGFIRACETASDDNTLLVIEAPYAGDTLKNCEFDQCYHEHLSFLTLKAMDALLAQTQFQIVSVLHFDIHGGTSALFLRKRGCDFPNQRVVREFIEAENLGLPEWQAFAEKAKHQINDLRSRILEEVGYGNRVAGLGASAKSTVWINACGFSRKEIAFIADNTPGKQLTVSPGTDIPIVDEGAILRELPDYVVLWAWNYKAEVLEKFAKARELGVRFIIPVPTIEIV